MIDLEVIKSEFLRVEYKNKMNLVAKKYKYMKFTKEYNRIVNNYDKHITGIDHIAFRSLYKGEKMFGRDTRIQEDVYNFPMYDVQANWYKTPVFNRIFCSYFLNSEKDPEINEMINKVKEKRFGDLYSYEKYLEINKKNQYLSWVLLHRDDINHIALGVRNIQELTEKLISDGFKMNCVNNSVYNISRDKNLIQTSTISSQKEYKFKNGSYLVPYTFVEFIQRYNQREGFDDDNANKIMKSTRIIKE